MHRCRQFQATSAQLVEPDELDDEIEDRPFNHAEQFCGGALVTLTKMGHQTQMMQIAERLGIWNPADLDMDAPVYEDLDEFVNAMEKS